MEPSLVKPTMPAKSLPSEDKGNAQTHSLFLPALVSMSILAERMFYDLVDLNYHVYD